MTIPVHVHATTATRLPAEEVARRLRTSPDLLATAATGRAHEATRRLAASGGFRSPAAPTVTTRPPEDDELGALIVRWSGDEDATGWPSMLAWVVPTATAEGTRVALLSPRHPGVDLSTNRIDKRWRDGLARTAASTFLTDLVGLVETVTAGAGPDDGRAVAWRPDTIGTDDQPHRREGAPVTELGGDPACWRHACCPTCGQVLEDGVPQTCPPSSPEAGAEGPADGDDARDGGGGTSA
jgi:hypothetical protein